MRLAIECYSGSYGTCIQSQLSRYWKVQVLHSLWSKIMSTYIDLEPLAPPYESLSPPPLPQEALAHPQCGLVYCTEILAEFPCDTFIPALDLARFTPVE